MEGITETGEKSFPRRSISWCQRKQRGLGVRLEKPTLDFSMGRHLPICRKFPKCSSSRSRMAFSHLIFPQFFFFFFFFFFFLPVGQQSPTFWSPGTTFVENNSSTDQGWGGELFQDDSSASYLLCSLFLLWLHQLYLISSDIQSQRLRTPAVWNRIRVTQRNQFLVPGTYECYLIWECGLRRCKDSEMKIILDYLGKWYKC